MSEHTSRCRDEYPAGPTRSAAAAAAAAADTIPDHRAFPALDGIRGLAVVCVVATHSAYWTGRYDRGFAASVLARLDVGVALFFVLSGFLLVRPWLIAAADAGPTPSVAVYAWRRCVRILPAYWVAVVFAFALVPKNRGHLGPWDYLRHATFTQIYHLGWLREGLTQTWTLCVEVAFYAVLPLFGAVILAWSRRFGWRPAHLLFGCGALTVGTVTFYLLVYANGWYLSTSATFWLPGYLDWFAGGMAMAVTSVHLRYSTPSPGSRWQLADQVGLHPGSCWLLAVALFAVAVTPAAGPKQVGLPTLSSALTKSLLYGAIAVLVVWPAVFGSQRTARLVFGNGAMRWLGQISYGVFLLHVSILSALTMPVLGYRVFSGSAVTVFAVTMSMSLAAGWASYRFIELPTMPLRRLVTGRPARSATVPAPTSG